MTLQTHPGVHLLELLELLLLSLQTILGVLVVAQIADGEEVVVVAGLVGAHHRLAERHGLARLAGDVAALDGGEVQLHALVRHGLVHGGQLVLAQRRCLDRWRRTQTLTVALAVAVGGDGGGAQGQGSLHRRRLQGTDT